jgi:hypothetical protein
MADEPLNTSIVGYDWLTGQAFKGILSPNANKMIPLGASAPPPDTLQILGAESVASGDPVTGPGIFVPSETGDLAADVMAINGEGTAPVNGFFFTVSMI